MFAVFTTGSTPPLPVVAIRAAVVRLLLWGSPSAIVGRVVAVWVDSINAMRWRWSSPHIAQKVLKLIPSATNFYTEFAIQIVTFIVWVVATLPHVIPRLVFGGLNAARCLAVRDLFETSALLTASVISLPKSSPRNNVHRTAFTTTQPHHPPTCIVGIVSLFDYGSLSKNLPRQVFDAPFVGALPTRLRRAFYQFPCANGVNFSAFALTPPSVIAVITYDGTLAKCYSKQAEYIVGDWLRVVGESSRMLFSHVVTFFNDLMLAIYAWFVGRPFTLNYTAYQTF
jgi:hypothetical protein